MDGITSALSSLSNSGALKDVAGVANAGSSAYNLYNQYQNQQYQNKLRALSTNPAAVSKLAAGYTQPLNAGLTAGVANQAQAYLASRGLSDSPQISQQVEAQAIAPWIQQNQQQGYQDALQALNLGGGAIPPQLQQQNSLDALTKAFSQFGQGGQGINPAVWTNLLQSGTTQPQADSLTYYPSTYEPDYSSGLIPASS